ncbi:hypothetical protein [Rhodopila globiformis]|uniref:DUF2281 domain-containing protein n=1 Tax=Rhodopila globiformis TaxID=1071 RepID=A0A2S6NP19_RHOGL|nr:hypothetical protein [Rhodopila globiformis]PPQ39513.1 hypothetical protein CCS01_01055 [Rhodopila globiformis]
MPDTQTLLEKIQALPAEQLGEVEDFIDFLTARNRRLAAMDRFLAVAPALEAAGVPPVTEDEIMAEVRAARTERRARQTGSGDADRT